MTDPWTGIGLLFFLVVCVGYVLNNKIADLHDETINLKTQLATLTVELAKKR